MKEPIKGDTIQNVKCQLFKDPETGRIRVRTRGNTAIKDGLMVECSRSIRTSHPLGTMFYAEEVKICIKPEGRIYARAKDQMIYLIEK